MPNQMKHPNQQVKARKRGRCKQLKLEFRRKSRRGGKRDNAGRKPKGDKAGVSHAKRPPLPSGKPVHVTTKLCDDMPPLRRRKVWQKLREAFWGVYGRAGFRIVHFSVQHNHIHLIIEACGKEALSRGVQAFKIRFANAINAFLGREKGTVFADRYYMHILRTPTEVRNGLAYVLLNGRRHGEDRGVPLPERWVDPYSSARYFEGWREYVDPPDDTSPLVGEASFWLLKEGWRRARKGRISIVEFPGPWPR
jgi:REP element-mobilizing transposase RayT